MLRTKIAGVELRNPLILASGVLGDTGSSLKRVYESGAGAVTTKSINLTPRQGHPTPIIVEYEKGLLNAVGLSSQPAEEFLRELSDFDFPLIDSYILNSFLTCSTERYRIFDHTLGYTTFAI